MAKQKRVTSGKAKGEKMAFAFAAKVGEIPPGRVKTVEIGEEDVEPAAVPTVGGSEKLDRDNRRAEPDGADQRQRRTAALARSSANHTRRPCTHDSGPPPATI